MRDHINFLLSYYRTKAIVNVWDDLDPSEVELSIHRIDKSPSYIWVSNYESSCEEERSFPGMLKWVETIS